MRTPRRSLALWTTANATLLATPVVLYLWWQRTSGTPGPSNSLVAGGDSFGLPLVSSTLLTLLAVPIVNLILRAILMPYPGPAQLLPRPRGSFRSIVLDAAVGLLLVVMVVGAVAVLRDGAFELVFPLVGFSYVLVALRAVVYARMGTNLRESP